MTAESVTVIFLIVVAVSLTGTGARLVGIFLWRGIKMGWWLLRITMMILLLFAVEESAWTYHHLGCNLYCWESGMPNYRHLPPGAPDPMGDHQYKPGGRHLPVTDERYYTMWQWTRRKPRHCETTRVNPHRTRTECANPDETVFVDD